MYWCGGLTTVYTIALRSKIIMSLHLDFAPRKITLCIGHSNIVSSKPLSQIKCMQVKNCQILKAVLAEQNSTGTKQLVPAIVALMV